MLATLYNVAVDLPLHESGWAVAFLWLCRCLYLFSYIRCYCCPVENECTCCDADSPDQVQVVLDGYANTGACTQCTGWNQTYVLEKSAGTVCPGFAVQPDGCGWTYEDLTLLNDCGGFGGTIDGITVCMQWSMSGSDCRWDVVEFQNTGGGWLAHTTFRRTYAASTGPCATWASESFPWFSESIFGCDGSVATCEVTSL